MVRPEKIATVEDIRDKIKSSTNIFLTDYSGLNVEQMTELRRELRKKKVIYRIAKNTYIIRAIKGEGLNELEQYLKGPTAVAFGADEPNIPAKIFYDSYKKREKPIIRCFYVDGRVYTQAGDLSAFANLPTKTELYTQILMSVQWPLIGLIASIEAPARELVSVLEALVKAKQ